jgi:molecular chaperone Hsp33
VVPLEGTSLSEAAHTYFRQSEQIPTEVRLAVAPHYVQRDGSQHTGWRVGGLIVQHLPEDGGIRMADLPDGRNDAPEDDEDDRWTKARVLMRTVEDHELLDPMLSPEQLLYRLYHEDGVRAFPPQDLVRQCRCSRERVETMLGQFSDDDRAYMVEDGQIKVTCEFCNAKYAFDPEEVAGE